MLNLTTEWSDPWGDYIAISDRLSAEGLNLHYHETRRDVGVNKPTRNISHTSSTWKYLRRKLSYVQLNVSKEKIRKKKNISHI